MCGHVGILTSLHAPNQLLRSQIVPSAKAYPLEALMEDCSHYFKTTGRRLSFEYTLLGDDFFSPKLGYGLICCISKTDLASCIFAYLHISNRESVGWQQEEPLVVYTMIGEVPFYVYICFVVFCVFCKDQIGHLCMVLSS